MLSRKRCVAYWQIVFHLHAKTLSEQRSQDKGPTFFQFHGVAAEVFGEALFFVFFFSEPISLDLSYFFVSCLHKTTFESLRFWYIVVALECNFFYTGVAAEVQKMANEKSLGLLREMTAIILHYFLMNKAAVTRYKRTVFAG